MISVATGLIAELGAGAFLALAWAVAREQLQIVAGVLIFAAIVMGVVNLLAIPLVYYVRRTPPPLSVTIAAVLIALAPWAFVLLMQEK